MDIIKLFEKYDNEYRKFQNVKTKFSNRPDLHAFILLDKLIPGTDNIISCSEHDEFFLSISLEELEKIVTEGDVADLVRCGIRLDEWEEGLAMFS